MDNNTPEAQRFFDTYTRADARFTSAFICQVVGMVRKGLPLNGETLYQLLEFQIESSYTDSEPDLDEGLKERARMLLKLAQ